MKITSEDCVRYLCASRHSGHPADWKRISKRKTSTGCVRTFENRTTATVAQVWESNGQLYLESQSPGDGFLIAFANLEGVDEKRQDAWHVWVTPKEYWEAHKCVDDNSPGEVVEPFRTVGLFECMESCFEPAGRFTKEQTKQKLEAMGFVNDPKFQTFCEDHC